MAAPAPALLIIKYRGRSVAVFQQDCDSYQDVLDVAQRTFQPLKDVTPADLVILATVPTYEVAGSVEITENMWPAVRSSLKLVTISLDSDIQALMDDTTPHIPHHRHDHGPPEFPGRPPPFRPGTHPSMRPGTHTSRRVTGQPPAIQSGDVQNQTITITFPAYITPSPGPVEISEPALLGKKVSELYDIIDARTGYSSTNSSLTFGGQTLAGDQTLASYNISSGDAVMAMPSPAPSPAPRKPVIYLYPPSSLSHVTVQLSLAPSWSFSSVYPQPLTTSITDEHKSTQSLTWIIAAEPDGTLIEKMTGTEVSYLYWEAIANPHLVTPDSSRASTPVGDAETFDPSRPSVTPSNSILLPIGKVPGYLDMALKALTLHTEARTSFITYWLPDLLKHEHVALRFLAQESYEDAAPMLVSPAPDVVTRVFMLFRGVASADVECWQSASTLAAAPDATSWAQVVGVDAARASDRGLFRVLEWGGMEVN